MHTMQWLIIVLVFLAHNSFAESLSFQSSSAEVKQEIKFLTDSLTCRDHYPLEILNENYNPGRGWPSRQLPTRIVN